MKFLISILMLAVLVGGCGVVMSPTYSGLLDTTTALAVDNAARADANQLTVEQMKACLNAEAKAWQYFRDARDGRSGKGEN